MEFCKKHGLSADFNPTFFSHPKCDPLTLSSPNEETRRFWVNHGKACVRISQYLAEELGGVVTMNIWTGDPSQTTWKSWEQFCIGVSNLAKRQGW